MKITKECKTYVHIEYVELIETVLPAIKNAMNGNDSVILLTNEGFKTIEILNTDEMEASQAHVFNILKIARNGGGHKVISTNYIIEDKNRLRLFELLELEIKDMIDSFKELNINIIVI
jgi:hypothetical protein